MDAHLAQEGKLPLLSASFFEALEGTLAAEPLRVPARLRIRFADLGAWSPADMQRIVEQNVRLRLAALCAQDRREVLAAMCVGLGGCLVLLLSYVFDTLVQRHLIFDFLTICGWVVAWDAGDRLLLRRGALRARKRRLLRLLHHGVAIA